MVVTEKEIKVEEDKHGVPISKHLSAKNESVLVPTFATHQESTLFDLQADYSRPHSRPGSVCVVPIGTMWQKNCWTAVVDMFMHTNQNGLTCWIQEVKDPRAGYPYEHLGAIIDHGMLQARNRGFEYVCVLNTDVLPEPDLLIKLLGAELPIIAPIILDPDTGKAVGAPNHEVNTGIKPMRWVPMSFLLIKATVLNCFGVNVCTGTASEDMIWEKFWHYGHRPYLDTRHPLKMATHATRSGNLTMSERWEWLKTVDERRRHTPNRKGPSDMPHQNDVYAPWLLEKEKADNANQNGTTAPTNRAALRRTKARTAHK